jgi:4'-phosphopantetheinyl transferase
VDRPPHRTDPTAPRVDDWPPPAGRVALRADEVHVWRIVVGAGAGDAAAIETLSEAERGRAARFHFADDRERYVASHVALRGILAAYLEAAPASLAFGEGPQGKPFVDAPVHGRALRFSLSHSGDVGLVAVSREREVGVDVERVRAREDLDGLAARYFSPRERAALAGIAERDRLRAFFEIWTLKEAYLKACGDGLLRELDAFDVSVGEAQPRLLAVRDRPGDEGRWALARIAPGAGYAGALARARRVRPSSQRRTRSPARTRP